MAKLEIPVKVYFGEIDEIIRELKQLQTYKLFEGAEEVLVDIDEVAKVLAKHVKATTAEPERKTGKWIPVSEKLPEDFQQVLVWYEYWHWKAEELKPEYGIGWRFRGLWCGDPGNGSRLRVIAWMPLPKPFREKKDE